ncbi:MULTISPECIES: RsiG family protein [Streptomycetaceae]|uniref:Aerial mycelium formation protein n=1 Tax=Streptantibioticus cattleyicolor (strain ATCC 35852 / DSM 46488 / JCM 4925 / NBRC 14057 / NRRL 8057) TaxID=1003195 RepID=F8K135_STREN|nr:MULTISPECIES: hypothetical protein [Streptomycetaceae]AEW94901.1 aerial mycelium formation protein [Streptantibioticus cattleyicolor NRRL 8057 = DSM 46488]MYS59508.1 AmfC protein [Streptomyces sp. SID5468]CCB75250.1 AmfC [Streptantibioticus cattleyicolor NRRL 8057 = DSM 46488]
MTTPQDPVNGTPDPGATVIGTGTAHTTGSAPTNLTDLTALALPRLRTLRRDAQQEEADLSYLRRLLQGRVDILRAELARRTDPPAGRPAPPPRRPVVLPAALPLLDRLPEILTDDPSAVRQSARHVTLGTPRGAEYRRLADRILDDVGLSDLSARTDTELRAGLARMEALEQDISRRRRGLQETVDGCSAEITRRYREGEARIDDLLSGA